MKTQACIIGLGQFGRHLARTLVKMGCEVLGIDRDERLVDEIRDDVHRAIVGDARDPEMLNSVLSSDVDEAVICLGDTNLEASILCTLNLKRIGIQSIRSTAANEDHAQILEAVGATQTIFPERDAADRTARLIATPDIRDMFPLSESYRIIEMTAPVGTHGKSLAELELRASFDILILAVRPTPVADFSFLPRGNTVIQPGSVLMILGRELDLARFEAYT
jgi:trk system potassium uptake protein TrkA